MTSYNYSVIAKLLNTNFACRGGQCVADASGRRTRCASARACRADLRRGIGRRRLRAQAPFTQLHRDSSVSAGGLRLLLVHYISNLKYNKRASHARVKAYKETFKI